MYHAASAFSDFKLYLANMKWAQFWLNSLNISLAFTFFGHWMKTDLFQLYRSYQIKTLRLGGTEELNCLTMKKEPACEPKDRNIISWLLFHKLPILHDIKDWNFKNTLLWTFWIVSRISSFKFIVKRQFMNESQRIWFCWICGSNAIISQINQMTASS